MAKYPQLKVNKRKISGRKVKQLRNQGLLPANVYGKNINSQTLELPLKDFLKIYSQVGETGLVELWIEGEKSPKVVLIHNLQKEPVNHNVVHVDFRQVDLKEKIVATVPIEIEGEAPGEASGGILVQVLNEIEVEALPADLPEKIMINVSKLEQIDESVSVKDLIFDKAKIQLKVDDPEALVVKIEAPQKEEVEVKPAEEVAPVEAEGAKSAEAGKPGAEVKPTEATKQPVPETAKKEEKK